MLPPDVLPPDMLPPDMLPPDVLSTDNSTPAHPPPPSPPPNRPSTTSPHTPNTSSTNQLPPPTHSSFVPSPPRVSEHMRRIQDMLSAGKLTTSHHILFTHHSTSFTAQIMPDGSLKASLPHTPKSSPPKSSSPPNTSPSANYKFYSSPTEFASEMASSLLTNPKSRPNLVINGWDQCKVDGRPLAALRNEMLRSKRLEPVEAVHSPRSARPQSSEQPNNSSPKPIANHSKPLLQTANHNVNLDHTKSQPDQHHNPITTDKHQLPDKQSIDVNPPHSTPKVLQNPPAHTNQPSTNNTNHAPQPSKLQPKSLPPSQRKNDKPLPPETKEKTSTDAQNQQPLSTNQQPVPMEIEIKPKEQTQIVSDIPKSEAKSIPLDAQQNHPKHAPGNNATSPKPLEPHKSSSLPQHPKLTDPILTDPKPTDPKPTDPKPTDPKPTDPKPKQVEPLVAEKSAESEGDKEPSAKETQRENSTKRMRSPAKQDSKKRKRKNSSESTPSGANTPNRKTEKRSKEQKATDVPTTVDRDVVHLDPETREAAAIAAQADKEEANSRARRTTRLAAGKIKLVDYKASANPQNIRASSPGQDFEEGDVQYQGNEAGEPTRTLRRRAAQNNTVHNSRSSRRNTRQRGSYEREVSSNDELDQPGWRSSGNGSQQKHGSRDELEETAAGNRANGLRSEVKDRKRAKTDRKGRHSNSSDGDRGHNGSNDSADNRSHDAMEEDDEVNEEEDVEEETDVEKRRDAFNLSINDLACIGTAIRETNSLDSSEVMDVLQDQSEWENGDDKDKSACSYIERISRSIKHLRQAICLPVADIDAGEAVAFIAADMLRLRNGALRTGYARKPTAIVNRAHKEEAVRNNADRSRKKEQRDADEARNSLEREMDSRRKAEVDLYCANAKVHEMNRLLTREKANSANMQAEISRYILLEANVRGRVEKAKLVLEKLHSERRALDNCGNLREDGEGEGDVDENGDGKKAKRRKVSSGCEDGDVEMREEESGRGSERAKEMARLQCLIAAREAEIERYERVCIEKRMRFNSDSDAKSGLETELHVVQSVYGAHGGGGVGGGVPCGPGSGVVAKGAKEGNRKTEVKSGGANRNGVAHARGKTNAKTAAPPVAARSAAAAKLKAANGKHADAPKSHKRKSSAKH